MDVGRTRPSKAARVRVVVEPTHGAPAHVDAELACTPAERARGLMFRRRLSPDTGMLFVFDAEDDHCFWMCQTYVPLDMIFVGQDERVVGVVERAEPLSLEPRRAGVPSRYVLEVAAGFVADHGVAPGSRVRLPDGFPPVSQELP